MRHWWHVSSLSGEGGCCCYRASHKCTHTCQPSATMEGFSECAALREQCCFRPKLQVFRYIYMELVSQWGFCWDKDWTMRMESLNASRMNETWNFSMFNKYLENVSSVRRNIAALDWNFRYPGKFTRNSWGFQ